MLKGGDTATRIVVKAVGNGDVAGGANWTLSTGELVGCQLGFSLFNVLMVTHRSAIHLWILMNKKECALPMFRPFLLLLFEVEFASLAKILYRYI